MNVVMELPIFKKCKERFFFKDKFKFKWKSNKYSNNTFQKGKKKDKMNNENQDKQETKC